MATAMTWDEECDALIVGSGAGGMLAVYTAAREGLATMLVEATDHFGGTTAYSGGGMWFPGNAVLRRAGDDDTLDDARTYFRAVVGDRTPASLQEAFLSTGAAVIDYLEDDEAFGFRVLPWPDYYGSAPKARPGGRHIIPEPLAASVLGELRAMLRPPLGTDRLGHALPKGITGGQALIGRFLLALSRQPSASLHLETVFEEFVVEGGEVIGAIVRRHGQRRTIRVRRGVMVAAGGFERNAELRAKHGVAGDTAGSMGCEGNLGLPISAGIAIGADVDLMSEAWWSPGLTP